MTRKWPLQYHKRQLKRKGKFWYINYEAYFSLKSDNLCIYSVISLPLILVFSKLHILVCMHTIWKYNKIFFFCRKITSVYANNVWNTNKKGQQDMLWWLVLQNTSSHFFLFRNGEWREGRNNNLHIKIRKRISHKILNNLFKQIKRPYKKFPDNKINSYLVTSILNCI